jgi:hypothetical protein
MATALFNRTGFNRRAARVLPQYFTPEYHPWWPLVAITLFLIGVGLAMFTGLFVAVGGTLALKFVGFPIGVFTVLILWLLPDVKRASSPPIEKLLVTYLAMIVLWPSYLAIVIPGLPWVTPPRLVLIVMMIVMAVHLPQFAEARSRIWDVMGHDKIAARLYLTFLAIAVLVMPMARSPVDSLIFGMKQEVLTFAPVVAVAWFVTTEQAITKILRLTVGVAVITMAIAVVENYMQVPPWADYIPAFLQIDPGLLESILSPQARAGDWRYRIRSVFPIVLYYTLYLNLVFPLVMYAAWNMKRRNALFAITMVALILHTVWYANARTAFIGMFMSVFGIIGLSIVRTMFIRRGGDHLHKAMLVGGLFLALAVIGGALASSHRLQMYTFGGGQHVASNDTREKQWDNTWRQLARNPIGAGPGGSPALVGTISPRSPDPIVDSLWINQLVEVGYLGFACFFGVFLRLAWVGIRTYMRSNNDEEDWAGILAIALINFVVCSSVVSFNDNNYLAIVMAVILLALTRRQEQRLGIVPPPALSAGTSGTALALR